MDLLAEDVRVLGCLIEKELTTPEQYPLTTNSLRLACNQKTNRDPVVDYTEVMVDQAMLRLRQAGLARTVNAQGMRASKHKHVLGEAWQLRGKELAVLGVLMVRGPQTLGELRTRTDRASGFSSLGEVESVLEALAARHPDPLVKRLDRRPGQKEERWAHLLSGDVDEASFENRPAPVSRAVTTAARDELVSRVERLEGELSALTARVEALCAQLGFEADEAVATG